MAGALQQRLQAEPGNAEAWVMLGRSYTMLGRYRDGAIALERAVALAPANANLLADLADVAAMSQGKRLAGAPARGTTLLSWLASFCATCAPAG